jgi:hypothetical protein
LGKPIDPYDVEVLPELEGIAEGAGVDAEYSPTEPRGALSVGAAEAAMRDHDGFPEAVCAHEDPTLPPMEDYVTVGSWIADTGRGTVRVTEGTRASVRTRRTRSKP